MGNLEKRSQGKLDQLTFTRFLAAVSIVVFHYGRDSFPFDKPLISFLVKQSNIGVSYFFILSGFVMIIAYGKQNKIDFVDFIKKRIARIYPLYFLAIFILLVYRILTNNVDFTGLILNIAVIQSWFLGYALSFNAPGWSLVVEMFFYLTFPFIFNKIYQRFHFRQIAFFIITFFIISQLTFHLLKYSDFYTGYPSSSHDFLYYLPIMHLNEFLLGNLTAMTFFKMNKQEKNYDFLILFLLISVGLLLTFSFGILYHNGMLAFIFIPLILLISLNNGILTKISNSKISIYLGEISYGLYILQMPVFLWTVYILNRYKITNDATLIFFIGLSNLIILSALSYKYIETPLRLQISKISVTRYYQKRG